MGRRIPTLDEGQRKKLLAARQRGLGLVSACVIAGVEVDDVRAVLRRDGEFRAAWRRARAARELELIGLLSERAKTDYRAAAWLLQKLNRKRYEDG